MMKSERYTITNLVKCFAPDEAKQHALAWVKREAGSKIYSLLEQMPNPVVIEIEETITEAKDKPPYPFTPFDYNTDDEIRIDIRLTPVQYRDVVLQKGLDFDPTVWIDKPTFARRLRYAITGK